jgi:PAS domain S-box-containing protein
VETQTGRFVRVNPKFCEIVGLSPQEMTASTFMAITHPDDWEAEVENTRAMVEGRITSYSMQKRYLRADGSEIWVNVSVAPLWKPGEPPTYHVAVIEDVTGRRSMEQELGQSEQRYQQMVESVGEGLWMLDDQGVTTFVNGKLAAMLGYPIAEILGRKFCDFMSSESREVYGDSLEWMTAGVGRHHEICLLNADASLLWAEVKFSSLPGRDREPSRLLALVSDVTERRRVGQALASSEERYRLVSSLLSDYAYSAGVSNGQVVTEWVTDAFHTVTGYTLDEVNELGGWPRVIHKDDFAPAMAQAARVLDGEDAMVEYRIVRKDGTIRWIRDFTRPIKDPHTGIVVGMCGGAQDITEWKQADVALRQSEERFRYIFQSAPVAIVEADLTEMFQEVIRIKESGVTDVAAYLRNNPRLAEELTFKLRVLDANRAAVRLFAAEKTEDLLGYPLSSLVTPDFSDAYLDLPVAFAAGLRSVERETQLRDLKGRTLDVIISLLLPEDTGHFNRVLITLVDITPLKAAEAALREHLNFESQVSAISTRFVKLQNPDLDAEIHHVLGDLGEGGGQDRVFVFQFEDDGRMARCTHEWVAAGVAPMKERVQKVSLQRFPWMAERLLQSEAVVISSVAELPKEAAGERAELERAGVKSVLEVPMVCAGEVLGLIGFDSLRRERAWSQREVALLRIVGEILANAIVRTSAETQLTESREQLRALAGRLQDVREEEGRRMSREIHDELGQSLTGLKLDLAWMERHAQEAGPQADRLREKLDSMKHAVTQTIQIVRRIAEDLRPQVLDDLGLVSALEWQAIEFEKRSGVQCHVSVDDLGGEVEQGRGTALFRIFQEVMTNITRHASAKNVAIKLSRSGGSYVLMVQDDGIGISEEQINHPKAFGLIGMRERAAAFGGAVEIQGGPQSGTRVTVRIPTGGS